MTSTILVERTGAVATVTLNRPQARNALSSELMAGLRAAMTELEQDDTVDVVILTGAGPAFCAGLDLKELGSSGANLDLGDGADGKPSPYPWEPLSKPVIGAVNGFAVTGGLELVLNCDILIASEQASFADTHARVGVLPGWGLTVLLPLMVGRGLARRMSLTGDYISAAEALTAGLVTQVVPHDELLAAAHRVADAIVSNNRDAVSALLVSYRDVELQQIGGGYDVEADTGRRWLARGFDPSEVEKRRQGVLDRGRSQAPA
ncbi:MAG: enoyl-CoA hydratase [Aeromicrobium sp.]|jgi:enoyl-CoA hydratase